MEAVHRRLQIFLALFLLVATIGTVGFMHLENLSFAEAFYYNIVTMSTVGYGDIHPTSPASRLFAILLIVMGGATFLGVIANGTEMLLVKRETLSRMRKVNMVLGVFFSEVGNRLLALLADCDDSIDTIRDHLLVKAQWKQENFTNLPETDLKHLAGDMNRTYGMLVEQWLFYLQHLKGQYPYPFSLAIRKNPFDRNANPIVV